MSRLVLLATACALALTAAPGFAREEVKAPAKKADSVERVLATLADAEINLGNINPTETPLIELLTFLSKSHGVSFVVLDEQFKADGRPNIRDEKPKFDATQLRGQSLHQFLSTTLESMGATYLLKNGTIEVVPVRYAAKACKAALDGVGEESASLRLREPLVSAVIKEKPLNEAVAKLAEMYDLTVIVAPQAGDAKTGFVTARLLNVPADKAIELLAVQCDLRVVRKGNGFLITSRDQSNELFGEKLERERQKIELEKLREAPAAPPKPPAPEPKP